MKRTLLTRLTAVLLGLVLTFGLVAMIGEQKVSAKADVKVMSVSFTVKDGDFVAGESTAKITFKVSKATKVVVEIKDSVDDTVYKKTYKKCKAKKNVSFTWDGKKAESDEYYVKVTAGKATLTSDKIFFYDETGFKKGSGSKSNPYIVSTPEEFLNVARFNGRCFKQTKDLDFSSTDFIPLFTAEDPFTGVYDGNDKTVKNISNNGSSDNTGFFRVIGANGVVKNLKFKDCLIAGNKRVGIVAGYSIGEIENCSVEGCTINASGDEAGLIAGNNNGRITSCTAKENLLKNVFHGGGIAGYNDSNGNIKKCETAENTITGSKPRHGGIVGTNVGTINMCKATDNTVSGGDDYGRSPYLGGIAGVNNGVVSKCEVSNLKNLISGWNYGCGGIVGSNEAGGVDTGCVYYGEPVQ